jgi:hypothetical protein
LDIGGATELEISGNRIGAFSIDEFHVHSLSRLIVAGARQCLAPHVKSAPHDVQWQCLRPDSGFPYVLPRVGKTRGD